MKKGIYDYFEDSLAGLGKEKYEADHFDDTKDGHWYRLLPARSWASPRIIQHLPERKIEQVLMAVRTGSFLLVEVLTHEDIDRVAQTAEGI